MSRRDWKCRQWSGTSGTSIFRDVKVRIISRDLRHVRLSDVFHQHEVRAGLIDLRVQEGAAIRRDSQAKKGKLVGLSDGADPPVRKAEEVNRVVGRCPD